jgi:predicted transposase YdaD
MSGLDVLSAIAATMQLANLLTTIIKKFGAPSNAPSQLRHLDLILLELKDKNLYQSATEEERARILGLISESKAALDSFMERKRPNVFLHFFWPEDAEEQLRKQNDVMRQEISMLDRVIRRREGYVLAGRLSRKCWIKPDIA